MCCNGLRDFLPALDAAFPVMRLRGKNALREKHGTESAVPCEMERGGRRTLPSRAKAARSVLPRLSRRLKKWQTGS